MTANRKAEDERPFPGNIHPATSADAALLVALEKELFPADPWGENAVASHLASDNTTSLLLTEDGSPAGYLLGSFIPPEGELYRIAVLPAVRRRGCGGALLSAFLREAEARGAHDLFLEVRESNLPAIALYESAGFDLIDRRKNYYRNPTEAALVMASRDGKGFPTTEKG